MKEDHVMGLSSIKAREILNRREWILDSISLTPMGLSSWLLRFILIDFAFVEGENQVINISKDRLRFSLGLLDDESIEKYSTNLLHIFVSFYDEEVKIFESFEVLEDYVDYTLTSKAGQFLREGFPKDSKVFYRKGEVA